MTYGSFNRFAFNGASFNESPSGIVPSGPFKTIVGVISSRGVDPGMTTVKTNRVVGKVVPSGLDPSMGTIRPF